MSAGNFFRTSAFALSTLLMVSCESPNSPHPEAAPPDAAKPAAAVVTGPVTGRTAYWEMYKMARQWAPDIVPLSLASKPVPGHKIEGGKAMAWAASFGSNAKKEVRGFTYSVIAAEGIVKGVEADRAMAWAGPQRDAMPFRIAEVAFDSDAAFQTASKKGEAWLKDHPKEDVAITLGSAARFNGPVWYLLWGNKKAGYQAWVSAINGELQK